MQVRLQPHVLTATDAYIGDQKDEVTRPEAVRTILTEGLKAKGYLP